MMTRTAHKLTEIETDILNTAILHLDLAKKATSEQAFLNAAQQAFKYTRQVIRGRLD